MLYVFGVSTGCTYKFDMNLAVKKVIELKTKIADQSKIHIDDQVLLCSGGEELKSDNIVGNYYGAGTDTNPIFLFSKCTNASEYQYDVPGKTLIDLSIQNDVEDSDAMEPNVQSATVKEGLSKRFAEAAEKVRREVDELVHAQHLQQQGWAAVIANLEDAKDSLITRKAHFKELYEKYLENRSCYQETIDTFPAAVDLLSKVPLLPKLMLGNECIEEDLETEHTLLSWFCSEPPSVLQTLAVKYQRSLDELDEYKLDALNEDIAVVIKKTETPGIKEVKGIEDRLSTLNEQITNAIMYEKEQAKLAEWFATKLHRHSNDTEVMSDVCKTFQQQLQFMLQNHMHLRNILEKCTNAKIELSNSINIRIKCICDIESEMYDLQVKIIFLEKHVRSVIKQYESFHQVHLAPQRYLKLLAEVCRRRVFSSSFMKWATELSAQTFKLYHKEISIRKSFGAEESKNMVDNLFPGMDDVPPPFAVECPRPFDQNLPNIVREDLNVLRTRFPELAHFCEVSAPDPMPYISHLESDSAFSSNIPSSRKVGDSADSDGKIQFERGSASPSKLTAPTGDYSSLPSESASLPNEVFSLTSSPFEDPLLPSNELELTPKHTKMLNSQLSADKVLSLIHDVNLESDGEEFETVDCYGPSVDVGPYLSDRKRSASAPRPNSTSEVINVRKNSDKCPKLSKARSDGDAISPIQERLKNSDSLLVSTDFQSTEYYIDDSMPSSYTESNATSPLLRRNRMVKSHHLVVAELQKQAEEKNGALKGAVSSLKNSHSNILKLHAKISALQKCIQDLQSNLHSDLSNLKAYVKEEFGERMSEVSQVIQTIKESMVELQRQTLEEKEAALGKAESEAEYLESMYLQRLEVERQKLNDAETQISNYEEYLIQLSSNLEEVKHEKDQMESELMLKKDIIQSMMLEHELELDSLRNQMKLDIQAKEDQVCRLTRELKEKQLEMDSFLQQKTSLTDDVQRLLKEKETSVSLLKQKESDFSERLKDLKQLQEQIKRLQDCKDSPKATTNARSTEEFQSLMLELERTKAELSEKNNSKAKELSDLEEKLNLQHRNEIEALRSCYKFAVNATGMEKSVAVGPTQNLDSEDVSGAVTIDDKSVQIQENWEAEKMELIQSILEDEKKRQEVAVVDALSKQSVKHNAEKAKILHEYEENVEKMKSRQMAEIQVSFNEAINSVTKEKDAVIEALRSKVSALEGNLCSIKFHLEKCSSSEVALPQAETPLSQSDSGASSSYKVLSKMEESRSLEKFKATIEPYLHISDQGLPVVSQEDQNYSKLLKKVNEMKIFYKSKMGPCIDCTYKISIFSCEAGDLILLCYEDKYDSFCVFHFGQFLHFLHSDSLQQLGLKIPAERTERWAIGVVTSKEFCITRKRSNRYKMSLGAKFYRVKVKPWNREKSIGDYQLHRNSQSTAYSSRTLPSPPEEEGAKGMSASAI